MKENGCYIRKMFYWMSAIMYQIQYQINVRLCQPYKCEPFWADFSLYSDTFYSVFHLFHQEYFRNFPQKQVRRDILGDLGGQPISPFIEITCCVKSSRSNSIGIMNVCYLASPFSYFILKKPNAYSSGIKKFLILPRYRFLFTDTATLFSF